MSHNNVGFLLNNCYFCNRTKSTVFQCTKYSRQFANELVASEVFMTRLAIGSCLTGTGFLSSLGSTTPFA